MRGIDPTRIWWYGSPNSLWCAQTLYNYTLNPFYYNPLIVIIVWLTMARGGKLTTKSSACVRYWNKDNKLQCPCPCPHNLDYHHLTPAPHRLVAHVIACRFINIRIPVIRMRRSHSRLIFMMRSPIHRRTIFILRRCPLYQYHAIMIHLVHEPVGLVGTILGE